MRQRFLIINGIIFFLFFNLLNAQSIKNSPYPKPWIKVPNEHPRLLMRTSDFSLLKKNMNTEEMKNGVKEYKKLLKSSFDGNNNDISNKAKFDGRSLSIIEARAFDFVLFDNKEEGKKAIASMRNFLKTIIFKKPAISRAIGHTIFTVSEVYDWCYPLLTKDDKLFFIDECEKLASKMEIGWPPAKQGAVTSHAGEAQLMRDLLSFSIAVYDERPEFYDWTMGRYLHEFIKPRDFWNTSFTHHQGDSYGAYRQIWDAWGQWITYRMSGEKVLNPNFGKVMHNWVYFRRPDGQLFREGDSYSEGAERKVFWGKLDGKETQRKQPHVGTAAFLIGNFYKDSVLKNEALFYNPQFKNFFYNNATWTPVQFFLFNDPDIPVTSSATLPLSRYNPSPYGGIVARTGWDNSLKSNDVLAFMKIGELSGGNHNHQDAGNFQIFYKGILASESGFYDSYNTPHRLNYQRATVAHNSLLIKDPNEIFKLRGKPQLANDGGQNQIHGEAKDFEDWTSGEFDRAKVLAHQVAANNKQTQYAYIKGDLTRAYTHKTEKVKEVLRSMLFVPTEDDNFPALFVVMDKVVSTNPKFKKTFLLHSQEEPTIDGNTSIIKRVKFGYNGMLVNQTLLPLNADVTMIGGTGSLESSNRFVVDGKNFMSKKLSKYDEEKRIGEFGWGRIEISPSADRLTDYFLNAMYVKDADKNLPLQQAELLETDEIAGVKQLGHVLLFAKGVANLNDKISFTVPGNDEKLNVIITGVAAGQWKVEVNGVLTNTSVEATDEGGLLYFIAPAGDYKLKRISSK